MPQEIEAKFLDIDIIKYRKLLKDNNCTLIHEKKLLRRIVFDKCDKSTNGFVRVRDEGDGITMTVKTFKNSKYADEIEVNIKETFENGVKFIEGIGLIKKAYQESYREKWKHPLANEITIDIIPGIPPYTEIESNTEENLNKLIDILNLDKNKMRFGSFDKTYSEYYGFEADIINKHTPFITFENIINEIKPLKNHDLLKNLYNLYKPKSISRISSLTKTKSKINLKSKSKINLKSKTKSKTKSKINSKSKSKIKSKTKSKIINKKNSKNSKRT